MNCSVIPLAVYKFGIATMFIKFRSTISLLLVLYMLPAAAQHAREYSFKNLSVLNGLASNSVSDVIQDKDGYIWIATKNGLQRYDGSSFITIRMQKDQPGSIPFDHVVLLYRDRKDRIWMVTQNDKIGIFDTRTFKYTDCQIVNPKVSFPGLIFESANGDVMLSQFTIGFYRFDERTSKFYPDEETIHTPVNWKQYGVSYDIYRKKYWISCDSGLVLYNPASRVMNYRGHNLENDPVIKSFEKYTGIIGGYADAKGNIIFMRWPPMYGAAVFYRYNNLTKLACLPG